MSVITVRAPAKLNLYLHIVGRRADGYHLLESLVTFADLADEITISTSDHLSLTISGEFAEAAGAGEGNLVLKAARLLQKKTDTQQGAALALSKNIPVGAGLGGGSADAAATLLGLNDFWRLQVPEKTLQHWAKELGADVAMCLASTPAIARGIGDELITVRPLPEVHMVLVHPRVPLLTADVYAAYARSSHPVRPAIHEDEVATSSLHVLLDVLKTTRNDLQAPAIGVSPLVAEVLLALETALPAPLMVRMTGSGACCFAIHSSADDAKRASAKLQHDYPHWWVKQARTLS